jgi:hypothetical protein
LSFSENIDFEFFRTDGLHERTAAQRVRFSPSDLF